MTSALVVGTPGSGKSAHAEELAVRFAGNGPKIYVATSVESTKSLIKSSNLALDRLTSK